MVEFENRGDKVCELFKHRPIGIIDLRSIGYYNVNYQKLIAMVEENFELFHYVKKLPTESNEKTERYNKMSSVSHRKRDLHHSDPYPWLAPDDLRRFQTDS